MQIIIVLSILFIAILLFATNWIRMDLVSLLILLSLPLFGIVPAEQAFKAVALVASTCFMPPVSHQSNALVIGPGGYVFADYLRVGTPLNILV